MKEKINLAQRNTPLAYSAFPLYPGVRTSFTTPLILEQFDKGKGEVIMKLLHLAKLKVLEISSKPGFKIVEKRGGRRI